MSHGSSVLCMNHLILSSDYVYSVFLIHFFMPAHCFSSSIDLMLYLNKQAYVYVRWSHIISSYLSLPHLA
jgi:hypothetical protein